MKKLTFEIRSPAHQQNAIHAVQQILPDPTKPIVVTIQERNRSLDQNRNHLCSELVFPLERTGGSAQWLCL